MTYSKFSFAMMLSGAFLLTSCAGAHLKGGISEDYEHTSNYNTNTLLIVNVTQSVISKTDRHRVDRQEMLLSTAPDKAPVLTEKDKELEGLSQILQKNQAALADELVNQLTKKGIRSVSSMDLNTLPPALKAAPKLHLDVNISLAQEGNRALRVLIGWGLGKSKLQTQISLEDTRFQPAHHCMNFNLHTDSGWAPGAFGMILPVAFIPRLFIAGANTGMDIYRLPDANRTAQKIAPEIERYYINQHWLPEPPKAS